MRYILYFLPLLLMGCKNSSLVTQSTQTINVTGYSELKVKPDVSVITLNATAKSDNKEDAVSQITGMVDSVLNDIKGMQIKTDELYINNLNIYWNYIYGKERERSIEYTAAQTIDIRMKFDVDEVGKLVQIVRKIPKLNFYINFDISEPRKDSLENVVSRMAIMDASKKAESIAEAAGLKITRILDITYQSDRPGAFMKSADMAFAQEGSAERINLDPQEIVISDNIKVTYQVRNK